MRVTDDGSPAAFDSQAFNVTVVAKPRLLSIAEAPDGFFTLVWQVYPGRTYHSVQNQPDGCDLDGPDEHCGDVKCRADE